MKKTTVLLPEDLIIRAKLKALKDNSSLSSVIKDSLEIFLFGKKSKKLKNPMKALGTFHIGIKKLYNSRSELYEDEI